MADRYEAGAPMLEPMGVGEILDAGFRLWRRNFGSLAAIVATVLGPVALLTLLFQWSQIVAVNELGTIFVDDPQTYEDISTLLGWANILASVWVFGAVLHLATREYIGQPVSFGEALREGFRRILPYLGLVIIFVVTVGLGFVVLIIPGIFLGISLGPALPAFWAEKTGVFEAVRRSWDLVDGRRGSLFGVALATSVLSLVFYFIAVFVLVLLLFSGTSVTSTALVLALLPFVIELLLVPLHPVMMTAAYYDLRVRKEAFDVELAAQSLPDDDVEPPPLIR